MTQEKYNLIITDPAGMGWLELHSVDGSISDHQIIKGNNISKLIKIALCDKCMNISDCGGIMSVSAPYNILKKSNNGVFSDIRSSECPLKGQCITYTIQGT